MIQFAQSSHGFRFIPFFENFSVTKVYIYKYAESLSGVVRFFCEKRNFYAIVPYNKFTLF
ncbi:hypothetical protein LEP1GSC166_0037 [Leptospira kirschneri]|nr:hypothetical protein LEP1GSC198_0732 [Leptospira kirschneri str. JB]EMK03271.1 hypothetical protein LEP1GSC166_0037 [Leptospira kirschneri]